MGITERKNESNLPKKNNTTQIQSNPQPPKQEIFIEPSPVQGVKVPFPSIRSKSEVLYSIVIPVRNVAMFIYPLLEDVNNYFENLVILDPTFTYEIIIVDIHSHDNTRELSINFAQTHKSFRVLHIPYYVTYCNSLLLSGIRTRGRFIFFYQPYRGVPISCFSSYVTEMNKCLNRSDSCVVLGSFLPFGDEFKIHKTSLYNCLNKISNKILQRFMYLEENEFLRCQTYLMTKLAAVKILLNLKYSRSLIDTEIIMISYMLNIQIEIAHLNVTAINEVKVSAIDKVDDFITIIQLILMKKFGLWKPKIVKVEQ